MRFSGIYSRNTRMFQHLQTNGIYHVNKMKDKNPIILTDAEKPFVKIQHPFVARKLSTK